MRDEVREMKGLLQKHLTQTLAKLFKEQWLDAQEVSDIFHISPRKLRILRLKGLLPYSLIDGKYFYRYADIVKLFKINYFKNHPIKKS